MARVQPTLRTISGTPTAETGYGTWREGMTAVKSPIWQKAALSPELQSTYMTVTGT